RCARLMKAKYSQSVLSLALLLIACVSVEAHSGLRGAGKSTTTTVPSVSGAKEVEAKPQTATRLQLIVGIDTANPTTTIPYYLADTVLDECIRRLGEASDVVVRPAGQHLTRGEAAKLAKSDKDRYVVWLELGNDLAGTSSQNRNGPNELWVNYVILEPGTAKTKQAGK